MICSFDFERVSVLKCKNGSFLFYETVYYYIFFYPVENLERSDLSSRFVFFIPFTAGAIKNLVDFSECPLSDAPPSVRIAA